jgi:hypothetical protein
MRDACILAVVLTVFVLALTKRKERVGDRIVPHNSANLENGSIILENGRGLEYEVVTQQFTRSSVTHVGIVCHDASGVPFIFHTSRPGATLTHLETWIRRTTSTNRVFVRHLSRRWCNRTMECAIAPLIGVPYTYRFWKAVLRQWISVELPGASDESSGMFCSELVCRVLETLGALDFTGSSLSPTLVLPCHFEGSDLPFVDTEVSDVCELSV